MSLFSITDVRVQDILHYPHLEIAADGVTFLLGKSGTGKSTLLRLLNATLSPTSGEILYRGQPLDAYDTIALRREILLVAQSVFLFDDTIRGNFAQFYRYRDLLTPEEETMRTYLRLCAADFSLDADCRTLSGGERQRVFLAVCLSFSPRVLLLDEPTSALDNQSSTLLMENLTAYCKEQRISLVVITHDQALAARYADAILSLDGEVEA